MTRIQREANRKNALRSTGPKTAKGKATAKMNALKHGLTAEEIVIPGEDGDKFDSLLEVLSSHLEPVGPEEVLLVERIAACLWRLRRCYAVEAGIFAYEMAKVDRDAASEAIELLEEAIQDSYDWDSPDASNAEEDEEEDEEEKEDEEYVEATDRLARAQETLHKVRSGIGGAFLRDAGSTNALTKLSRYEAAIERSLHRARHELERLQAARKGASVTPPVTIDVTVDHGNLPDPEGS
jgi:hypothetical protein